MESNHAWAKRCALYPCRARHPRLARRSSQTASTCQYSILKTQSKNLYESGDAWSRTTLALISYAFCALSVPRPASPFVKATFTGSLNILSNTNMVKDEKDLSFPRLVSSCSFIKTNKKYVIIILYPSFLDKQYVVDLPVSGKPHKQAHINVQQHQGCNL